MNPVQRYLPSIKRYSWILLACLVLSAGVGGIVFKAQSIYQASASIQIIPNLPDDGFVKPVSTADGINLAAAMTTAIMSRSTMEYVAKKYPDVGKRGYAANDLLQNIVITPSSTAPQVLVTATTRNSDDSVVLANAVANGYVDMLNEQSAAALKAKKDSINALLAAAQKSLTTDQNYLNTLPASNTPQSALTQAKITADYHDTQTYTAMLTALPPGAPTQNVYVYQQAISTDASLLVKPQIIFGLTAAVGLIIGVLIMMLMIFMDNRVLSPQDLVERLNVTYLGSIGKDGDLSNSPTQVRGNAAQEISDLGANLKLAGILPGQWRAPQGAVVLVTSVQNAEGKTSVASALAASMSRGGCSTLIMDCNLRRPATHLTFGMAPSGPGLSGILKAGGNIDDAVKTSPVPGVWVLPAGAPVDDPTLLLAQRLPNIIAQLRKKTDLIIIDGPSVLTGADASVLASMADGTVLLADYRHARMPIILRAVKILNSLSQGAVGVALNFYPRSGKNRFYAIAPTALKASVEPVPSFNGLIVDAIPSNGHIAQPTPNTPIPPSAGRKGGLLGPGGASQMKQQ